MGVQEKREVSVPDCHSGVTVVERVDVDRFALHRAFSSTHASVHLSSIYVFSRAPATQGWTEESLSPFSGAGVTKCDHNVVW